MADKKKRARPNKDFRHYHRGRMWPEIGTIFHLIWRHLDEEHKKDHPKGVELIAVYHRAALLLKKELGL